MARRRCDIGALIMQMKAGISLAFVLLRSHCCPREGVLPTGKKAKEEAMEEIRHEEQNKRTSVPKGKFRVTALCSLSQWRSE